MSNNNNEKKESPLAGLIITTICAILMAILGEDYVWYPFGLVEIPMQIVGAIVGVLGILAIVIELKNKKNKSDEK